MAGLINPEDVATVKERTAIEEVVREHVTLKPAGMGSLKGLCPFHDEKTPSFTVRPAVGAYHCFGCGEGGDVISFVMKVDHLTFAEAVERLAARLGMELRYTEGSRERGESLSRRGRLVEAHRAAEEFYSRALLDSPEGRKGRDFLRAKGFDGAAARTFGVGYAPRDGSALVRHLKGLGFTEDELTTGGLAGKSQRGSVYDRFRGRVVWPIRDITGDTVGFGARRIYDDDRIAAKYLNTAESPIYKKTHVLYGLDLAKRSIAKERTAVVVEGYTDVMACHLAGVTTAVATCGTAFGAEHIKTLRRLLRDEAGDSARVVFTFDGDAAGQAAAMKAFEQDEAWASQSFVAVAPAGQDPNELRQASGDAAVRALVEDAVPMFDFAVRTTIARYDLEHAEGRVRAMQAVAPIVATIRDASRRPVYARQVAGMLGVDLELLRRETERAARQPARESVRTSVTRSDVGAAPSGGPGRPGAWPGGGPGAAPDGGGTGGAGGGAGTASAPGVWTPGERRPADPGIPLPDQSDPRVAAERQLLQCALQYPASLDADGFADLGPDVFRAPAHQAVYLAMEAAGGLYTAQGLSAAGWVSVVTDQCRPEVRPLVNRYAVTALPVMLDRVTGGPGPRYVAELLSGARLRGLSDQVEDLLAAVTRAQSMGDTETVQTLRSRLMPLQRELGTLRTQLEG